MVHSRMDKICINSILTLIFVLKDIFLVEVSPGQWKSLEMQAYYTPWYYSWPLYLPIRNSFAWLFYFYTH